MSRWKDLSPSNRRYYLWMGLGQAACAMLGLFLVLMLILTIVHWATG